jgi:hypothetical protein
MDGALAMRLLLERSLSLQQRLWRNSSSSLTITNNNQHSIISLTAKPIFLIMYEHLGYF